jgi:hypothetical protein
MRRTTSPRENQFGEKYDRTFRHEEPRQTGRLRGKFQECEHSDTAARKSQGYGVLLKP